MTTASVSGSQLRSIGDEIRGMLRKLPLGGIEQMISMVGYHGFHKSRLPATFLQSVLAPYGLDAQDVQIEIVKVDADLTGEIHYHAQAHAFIRVLGPAEWLDAATEAVAYRDGTWKPIASGEEVDIPPGTAHGFSVEPGGLLWFLSVQAPPIVGEGTDDYHNVARTADAMPR